ncbi:Lipase 1 [Grifola frondosa]|uniref:Carboxylic ester hydrolase n=1 Tax=Grifola frondosa TaxID=5627 RepID=A0A1C7LL30_GRIFR|nr:Lipase 1 [Grifola frondosa]
MGALETHIPDRFGEDIFSNTSYAHSLNSACAVRGAAALLARCQAPTVSKIKLNCGVGAIGSIVMVTRTFTLFIVQSLVAGAALSASTPSIVHIDDATVIGTSDGFVTQFLGIPFAEPPTGNLRLRLPQPIQREDCLNINVIVPAGTSPDSKLPIAAWIYGGGYQVGSNAVQPGNVIVNRSIELGQPAQCFRFPRGAEVANAGIGNLGLQDQRAALRWVQKYISAFGGDPTKVTIWGESAGSQSVAFQMFTNGGNTEGLFRAGFMESGSALPTGNFTKLQSTFDFIVAETGCSSARDSLECLRTLSAEVIITAMDKTPTFLSFQALNTPWMPHADGVFLKDNPQMLVLQGSVADIPFIIGDTEDEGTLFSLASLNITTDTEFSSYGDFIFQAPRRFLLDQRNGKQPLRSFTSNRAKVPGLGAAHSTDLENVYGGGDMADYLIRFVATLNPNGATGINWPEYTVDSPQLLAFVNGSTRSKSSRTTFVSSRRSS